MILYICWEMLISSCNAIIIEIVKTSFSLSRWHSTMDDMGLLHFSHDVWTECHSHQWISWQKMECSKISKKTCKQSFCSFKIIFTFSLLQPNPDPFIPEPTVGKVLLKARGMFKEDYWYWICVGALLGFSVLFNICFIIALTFLNRKQSFTTLISSSVTAIRF